MECMGIANALCPQPVKKVGRPFHYVPTNCSDAYRIVSCPVLSYPIETPAVSWKLRFRLIGLWRRVSALKRTFGIIIVRRPSNTPGESVCESSRTETSGSRICEPRHHGTDFRLTPMPVILHIVPEFSQCNSILSGKRSRVSNRFWGWLTAGTRLAIIVAASHYYQTRGW